MAYRMIPAVLLLSCILLLTLAGCDSDSGYQWPPPPLGSELLCSNGLDDDADGLTDCEDPDCMGDPACTDEICDDGVDNDADTLVDCDDPDCAGDPACGDGWCEDIPDGNCTACELDGNDCTRECRGGTGAFCPVDCSVLTLAPFLATGEPCTDDGFACTTDPGGAGCDGAGLCGSADHTFCDDGQFCNGAEACNPIPITDPSGSGCTPGTDPCPDPGAGCDEALDRCVEVNCSDGLDNDGDTLVDTADPDC
jgi:hypothetical protein